LTGCLPFPSWQKAKESAATMLSAASNLQTPAEFVAAERHLWPAKILNEEISHFRRSYPTEMGTTLFDARPGMPDAFGHPRGACL
jgi:hypothetical protein